MKDIKKKKYLRISGIHENSSIENRSVDIRNHTSNISKGVRFWPSLTLLYKSSCWLIPHSKISFVDGVDLQWKMGGREGGEGEIHELNYENHMKTTLPPLVSLEFVGWTK